MTLKEKILFLEEKTGIDMKGIKEQKINWYMDLLKDPFPLLQSDLIPVIRNDVYFTRLYGHK
ncbi:MULTISPECIES: hypothetical protein [Enterococcus]|uniref:hypothetical protein n=1 Tax=Enterococcus TaxID=1350 RepID=UPI000CF0FD0D|nr:hypothetical protein [Enterococcus faecium]EGP4846572.1 hypothetical protein [Enterococcus faecium]EGP4892268.1 hypothetical protein [Enterococcus faecium]EGP4915283.1 hypothetical protein [Enterococcus faecium]EGP5169176.1 hypothetical protein [Enterococcus faecium]EGP5179446.1 hypothetical protein [Enterococcus faecium]